VDLAASYRPADWPGEFVTEALDWVADSFTSRDDTPRCLIWTGSPHGYRIGPTDASTPRVIASGPPPIFWPGCSAGTAAPRCKCPVRRPPCAERAKSLRVVRCREGWHLEDEPDTGPPGLDEMQEYWQTGDQRRYRPIASLTLRATLRLSTSLHRQPGVLAAQPGQFRPLVLVRRAVTRPAAAPADVHPVAEDSLDDAQVPATCAIGSDAAVAHRNIPGETPAHYWTTNVAEILQPLPVESIIVTE